MKIKPYSLGFTLFELMIVVALIGIMSAIAYPSNIESVTKSWDKNADSDTSDTHEDNWDS